ncbi:uncharacterized protein EDB93DRAFT_1254989 [Suillus bovinus]|uniref:uncharacterized protein n=1 Tax=Suillus bovinus TaxID=48563 RepID=UPI001B87907B|nr:uncharacterized protein EDB93DRAFT_1254989 [Suillus bovinus]KAG2133217.1 hypothetical protein EDB93DRAFT_1254989 [Suillus bovinus]
MDQTRPQDAITPDPAPPTLPIPLALPPPPPPPVPMPLKELPQPPALTPVMLTPPQPSPPILPTNMTSNDGAEAASDLYALQPNHDDMEFDSEPLTSGFQMQPAPDGPGESNRAEPEDGLGQSSGAEPGQTDTLQRSTSDSLLGGSPSPLESAVVIPAPHVDGEDPLCGLRNVPELDVLHLKIKFQPDIKLFVVKQDIAYLARIKGLGAKYLSTISSASEIDHTLLDALMSWHIRHCPFQILQEKHSVEGYGVHIDHLIMMILHIKFIQTSQASDEETSGEAGSNHKDYGELEDDEAVEEDVISPGLDWDDMDFADGDEDEEDKSEREPVLWPDEDEHDVETLTSLDAIDDQAPYPIFLNAIQKQRAEILREFCANPDSSEEQLMEVYHLLLLSVFTTHSDDNPRPLQSLVDSFIMSTSIDVQGCFASPHLISSHLAKIIYGTLFCLLTNVMKSLDPYQAFMTTMKAWIEPGHIGLPRLQFTTSDGPDFTFDDKSLSVTAMTQMYHSIYQDMVRILEQDLLLGASNADLQPLKTPEEITDKPHEHVLGRGVLVSEMQAAWCLMKFLMSDQKLMKKFFTINPSGHPVPRKGFKEDISNEDAALSLQASYAHQQSSSKRTLSSLWTSNRPVAASNSDLMLDHNLLEEIQSMQGALAQLTRMVSSIYQVVLPSDNAIPAN